ncbi:phosphoglycerate kinase [bacterium]|nr:phosphoglycerate kinase [bacterium]
MSKLKEWAKPFRGKTVIVRLDLNIPVKDGVLGDERRLCEVAPTMRALVDEQARPILLSHWGKPGGRVVPSLSLAPLAKRLAFHTDRPVSFCESPLGIGTKPQAGVMTLLENCRFLPGETQGDCALAQAWAKLGDSFILDAFSVAHRPHASVSGIGRLLPSVSGPLLRRELEGLLPLREGPKRPFWVVMGGAKLSTKLPLMDALRPRVEGFVVGGGIANTFLLAKGIEVGTSLVDHNSLTWAKNYLGQEGRGDAPPVILPEEVVVKGKEFRTVAVNDVKEEEAIMDIPAREVGRMTMALREAATVFWNGAFGAFEIPGAERGTLSLASLLSKWDGYVVAGGGETLASLEEAGVKGAFSFESLGGGATLAYIAGENLPGLEVLE